MTAHRRRVLVAGLYHETHTFVPGRTTPDLFSVTRGEELWSAAGQPSPMGGALDAARRYGWEVIPAIDCRATPGGIVEHSVVDMWGAEVSAAAAGAFRQGGVDALFLVLHGAMVTERWRDVEGELLTRIRALPGLAQVPIVGVTDLHANVSDRMARAGTALITNRENPHTDARRTAERAAEILERSLADGADRPLRTWFRAVPLILPPTATGTADEPMRTLEALAREAERDPEIAAVNVHAGFAFADTADTGVSFTVCSTGGADRAEAILKSLCEAALETPIRNSCAEASIEEAMRRLRQSSVGPVALVEPSDNIGAGAPGEGVALLDGLLRHGIRNAGVIVRDPEAVSLLIERPAGSRHRLRLGARSSPAYGEPVTLEVELISCSDGRFDLEDRHSHAASMSGVQQEMGPCALVRTGGVTILITSRPLPPFDLAQWRSQGVNPETLFAIGVKAAVAHRRAYDPITRSSLYVATPGPCASDLRTLPFQHVRRPIRPLDD